MTAAAAQEFARAAAYVDLVGADALELKSDFEASASGTTQHAFTRAEYAVLWRLGGPKRSETPTDAALEEMGLLG
jgi:hypothetical protein